MTTAAAVAAQLAYAPAAKMPIDSFKNLQAWYGRIDELPAWQKSAPKM